MHDRRAERGFVTIATGDERYYRMALNLLRSYRFHADYLYPFALICDRATAETAEFDDVIVLNDPSNSYNDKLRLYEFMPYYETIFIDADSLAYGNLNAWWTLFEKTDDFCVFGCAYRDLAETRGWFYPSDMKEFSDKVKFIPSFNGGVYYMRKTEKCAEVFRIAKHCAAHYYDYSFTGFSKPADEPVLALGMAVCGCEPLDEKELVFAPKPKEISLDIINGIARKKGVDASFRLVHWSNYLTRKKTYRYESGALNSAVKGWPGISRSLYQRGLAKLYLWIYDVAALLQRARRKFKRLLCNL